MSKIKEHYHEQIEAGQRAANEKPILFSTSMVQAILEGRKTQTRRVIKPQPGPELKFFGWQVPEYTHVAFGNNFRIESKHRNPYGQSGDLLWVRETWKNADFPEAEGPYEYKASMADINAGWNKGIWKPSIHMPKHAARIWLRVKDVKVERLQEISYADAKAEGVEYPHDFYDLWFKINGPLSWNANPWVWVVEFEVVSTSGKPATCNLKHATAEEISNNE
jgi:hypothetical protein